MNTVLKKYQALPVGSGLLVTINVVIYILCSFPGNGLYEMGRLSVLETVVNREYGRILWALFLHGDITHIFNNMLLVLFLGGMVEQEIGHAPYALCYFLSGIGGNVLSLAYKVVTNDWVASIGASGAVFGLDGVLLAIVLLRGEKTPTVTPTRVLLMILLSLYNGFTGSNIDNAAHVGGLVTGFALGAVICLVKNRKQA